MAKIVKEISVDVAAVNFGCHVDAKQNDSNSRFLKVTLTNEGVPVEIGGDTAVTVNVLRADGERKIFAGDVNADGSVTVPIADWLLAVSGCAECDISVVDADGRKLTSFLFEVEVERSACSSDVISDSKDFDLLVRLISSCREAKNDCNSAADTANTAAETANTAAANADSKANAANTAAETATAAAANADRKAAAANTAADTANTAAANANSKATAANTAAETANTAAANADSKAKAANTAAETANTAAANADSKANTANTAAEAANTAAANADSKANAANTAASTANTAASNANSKASTANTAATNANSKANAANTAATNANTAATAANNAATAANSAAAAANEAADSLPTLLAAENITYDNAASGLSAANMKAAVDELSLKVGAAARIDADSWSRVQAIVRAGLAPQAFKIGDQLTCSHSKYGELVWDVIGIDHDTPTDTKYTHSLTLQLHSPLSTAMDFDKPEATWYVDAETYPDGFAAGTYNFVMPSDASDFTSDGHGGGNTYQFTTTKTVPAGGQLRFTWQYYASPDPANSKVITYSTCTGAALETVAVTLGSEGTALPMPGGNNSTEGVNDIRRSGAGSANWKTSAIRQWLNSEGAANAWWTAQTVYDRPPSYSSSAGFLNGMDADFRSVLGKVKKKTLKYSGYDMQKQKNIDTIDESDEKVFLLSCTEVYGGSGGFGSELCDGEVYAYYGPGRTAAVAPGKYYSDSNRLKYKGSTKICWWLRSEPAQDYALHVHNYSGTIGVNTVSTAPGSGHYDTCYVVPACCIV